MNYLDFFFEISKISRPSGKCRMIADYLVDFAKKQGLEYIRDASDNVIIKKAASKGYESCDAVMLQGHTDIVTAVADGHTWNFSEGVEVVREGNILRANGTTLGADNGIAVSYMLAILSDDTLSHPALECVFTSDEETGLFGAYDIDLSSCKATRLINMDSEEEGVITAGCCGGLRMNTAFKGEREFVSGDVYKLTVKGLRGGHSGTDIDRGRQNALRILTQIVKTAEPIPSYKIVDFSGGEKDNAIPRFAEMTLVNVKRELFEDAIRYVSEGYLKHECDSSVTLEKVSEDGANAFSRKFTDDFIGFMLGVPNGVLNRTLDPGNPPSISDNFGVAKTEGNEIRVVISFRAYDDDYRDWYADKAAEVVSKCGGTSEIKSKYPGWAKSERSLLRDRMCEVWKNMTGEEMKVQMIHAGLECGILISKLPHLDAVSIGPNMEGVHTPNEKLYLDSADKCYGYIVKLLEELI